MRCPVCRKETSFEGNPYRPFCSERCKWLDLDNWLSERYQISSPVESRDKVNAQTETVQDAKRSRD